MSTYPYVEEYCRMQILSALISRTLLGLCREYLAWQEGTPLEHTCELLDDRQAQVDNIMKLSLAQRQELLSVLPEWYGTVDELIVAMGIL